MYTRLVFLSVILLNSFAHISQGQTFNTSVCTKVPVPANNHPKAAILQSAINQLVEKNVPGAVAAISNASGTWIGAAGFAKLEDGTPMGTCHLHYLQSIAKTYLAVVIMQLYEAGKIDLDARATNYLPEDESKRIPGIEKVTVRMLLSHTSGLPEYNYRPTYITRLLQNPSRLFSPAKYIDYVEKAKPVFEAGTKYQYSNFGYVVLSLIADQVTGDHAAYMRENVFAKLGLQHTFYRIDKGNTYDEKLVNSYWDRHSNGSIENISVLQNSNVASMAGDDGVITTPEDAILFLKGLMEGKLLLPETLAMMMEWTKDSKGNPRYGLGLTYATIANEKAIGHSGGGLGAGAELYYFPEKKVYMFLAINLGTVTASPIHDRTEKVLNDLHAAYVQ